MTSNPGFKTRVDAYLVCFVACVLRPIFYFPAFYVHDFPELVDINEYFFLVDIYSYTAAASLVGSQPALSHLVCKQGTHLLM